MSLGTTKLDHACGNQLYERKQDPFVSYQDVQSKPSRMANIVDFSQFSLDLANNNIPAYVWISPDQCHDMHGHGDAGPSDPCDFSQVQSLIAIGATMSSLIVIPLILSPLAGGFWLWMAWDLGGNDDMIGNEKFYWAAGIYLAECLRSRFLLRQCV